MYVGVGASRVRKLFAKAKKHDKCIIFIDEIDAIGKKRGFDNNSERDNTLNQLLVEMDGFDETTNIIIFAATNLVKKLDSALTRSGRFDKKVYFDAPNFKERREMFKLYLEDIKLPTHLSFEILSERGAGLTGADIATICNQAKINAIQGKQLLSTLREEDLQEAIDEIMIGREKRERTMTKEERERVSHHEAGHALMGYLLKDCTHPIKVSIVPRGEAALGFSQQKNENKKLFKENTILSRIAILLGGRTAEKIIYNNVSTGAADDIEKASSLIYNYTCSWGMNKHIGPLNPEVMGAVGRNLSEESFEECKQIMAEIEDYVLKTLKKHKKYIKSIAELLLKEETINYKQIKELVPEKLENTLTVTIS
jgi:ATP-dependent metalloprotease FtsH